MIPDETAILAPLKEAGVSAVDVHVFEQLPSTSVWLREQKSSLTTQLQQGRSQVCVTDWQVAGVGRRGKSWQTASGNITFSVLSRIHRPMQELLGLSLVTGIAVAEALTNCYSLPVQLKWPNDLIVNDRKLGGLLTEIVGNVKPDEVAMMEHVVAPPINPSDTGHDMVTGIGINVLHSDDTVRLGLGSMSLESAGFKLSRAARDELVGYLCAAVLQAHAQFLQDGWLAFAERWRQLDWLLDKEITIYKEKTTEHAWARGVNDRGALLIERAGVIHPLFGGNVSIRPTV